jgi:nucleotide sugar dehydrogenase
MKKNVLIIGFGTVGRNLYKELSLLEPDIYDKYKFEYNTKHDDITYDFAFICVDTPYVDENNPCDISQIEDALEENKANIYIIKSTILPGTTYELIAKHNKRIVFSPEYYGGTQHCNNFDFNFTILGGTKRSCIAVQQLLQNVYDGRHIFRMVDSETAELAKYMENCWLATKVTFCNEFYQIAANEGINYEELRELFILDPRVNPSHTFVYRDHPYWDSHCLNKDVKAIQNKSHNKFLKAVIDCNERSKR